MKDGSALLNASAVAIADAMVRDAERLRVVAATGGQGERLIDAGARVTGSVEAGLRMAEAAMGGLGEVALVVDRASEKWPFAIEVRSSQPVLACLGSQYAGWNLSSGRYFAMGSGPARALARVEPLYETLAYRERAASAVLVLETAEPPPAEVVDKVAGATGVPADGLTFLYAPTQSLAGTVQIVARALEVALHKANDLGFPLERIVDGVAAAPVPAPHPDFLDRHGAHQRRHHLWRPSSSCSSAARPTRRRRSPRSCRAAPRATTAGRSARSSRPSMAISTPSTRCCSARPR